MASLYAWNEASESAKALAQGLGIKRLKHIGSKFKGGGPQKVVINWGSSELPPEVRKCTVLNTPESLATVSGKLAFFETMAEAEDGPRAPAWATTKEDALKFIADGHTLVARTVLNGHSGKGIVLCSDVDSLVSAPLYTVYKKKKDEYRLHFAFGELIDVQRKAIKRDFEGKVNHQVRNLANGYVYIRGDVNPPEDVKVQAEKAYKVSGLDFGAVDVIYNDKEGLAYVLEINSAPGLSGTTLENYVAAFKKRLNIE
jgi:glutathione synthase/RimK-type ligase-like ATP-grasp enzyme